MGNLRLQLKAGLIDLGSTLRNDTFYPFPKFIKLNRKKQHYSKAVMVYIL